MSQVTESTEKSKLSMREKRNHGSFGDHIVWHIELEPREASDTQLVFPYRLFTEP